MVFSSLPLLDAVRPDGVLADRGATTAERAQRAAKDPRRTRTAGSPRRGASSMYARRRSFARCARSG